MSQPEAGAREEAAGESRLRKAERRQIELVPRCADILIALTHPVRAIAAVAAAKLPLSPFRETIQAREA